jgi:hypothetical protein
VLKSRRRWWDRRSAGQQPAQRLRLQRHLVWLASTPLPLIQAGSERPRGGSAGGTLQASSPEGPRGPKRPATRGREDDASG